MKKMSGLNLLIGIFLIVVSTSAFASDFCRGFYAGYKTGYKQAKGTILEPLTPLCPLQPLKRFGDPNSDFEHGYTLGYQKGMYEGRQ